MTYRNWFIVITLIGCFLALRPQHLASVQADDGDREHEIDRHENDDQDWDEENLEMHALELEIRQQAIEVEISEMELKQEQIELLYDPLATSLDAIDVGCDHLAPEEAVEFFAGLIEKTDELIVRRKLRQRLVELNFDLDRREEAKRHLQALIVSPGE